LTSGLLPEFFLTIYLSLLSDKFGFPMAAAEKPKGMASPYISVTAVVSV
jgi:hypothetical protein